MILTAAGRVEALSATATPEGAPSRNRNPCVSIAEPPRAQKPPNDNTGAGGGGAAWGLTDQPGESDHREWLECLHRRAADRVAQPLMREALQRHCWLEAPLAAGWPSFRLCGTLPPGHPGDPYSLGNQYREALQAVLRELAGRGAMANAVTRTFEAGAGR